MSAGLKVVVDGIIYQHQSHGGISRLYSEILPRMCNLESLLDIEILTIGGVKQPLPDHKRIFHRPVPQVAQILRPWRLWKPFIPHIQHFVKDIWTGRGDGKIWHSTYYTLPPERWTGRQVVTVVDMIHERFPKLFNRPRDEPFREQKQRCVLAADAVICISETTRQDIQRFYGLDSNSIYVVALACSDVFRPLDQRSEELRMSTEQPFLLYVGSRSHYKNFNMLIQAYSVWLHRKEVALVVVGKPWTADEVRRLMEWRIQDRVHLLEDVDDEELCRLYNQTAAFVYPSLYEGFGIPLLEALACGCPVIASRIPSTIEVAGDCPIYFEAGDVDDLVHVFDVALAEGRNSERVQAGFEQVKCYSWDKTAKQTLDVYHALSNLE